MTAVVTDTPTATHRWTIDDVFDRLASIRALAILRLALGPIVILHLWPFLRDTATGRTYDDTFFEPWWAWVPTVPGWVQVVLVWTGAAAAIGLGLGWRTRLVAPLTFVCVAGNFFLSQHHFRHNRAFLLYLLAAVALADSGRVLSLDARRARARDGSLDDRATVWPMFLLRVLASSIYVASGLSKLVDTDWSGGLVLWDRAVRYQQHVRDSSLLGPLADPIADLVTARWFHTVTSPLAVAMELFIAFGLWHARTRLAAVWTAMLFHLSIEVAASVEVFSAAAIGALVIWATPRTRDRSVLCEDGRWIRRLDWLARFDIREEPGAPLRVIDRDGTVLHGGRARWLVLTRLPLLFFVTAPLSLLARRRAADEAERAET